MKTPLLLLLLISVGSVAVLCCAGSVGGGRSAGPTGPGDPATPKARAMKVLAPAFGEPEVVMLKSLPPQFELVLERDMPTPGWSFTVDSVNVDEANRRIVVQVTEVAPAGMTAQVITPTKMKIPLGFMPPGRFFLELWLRGPKDPVHKPAQALILLGS